MLTVTEQFTGTKPILFAGIRIHCVDFNSITRIVKSSIEQDVKVKIIYANAYSIVVAKKNELFKSSLVSADLVHPDGIGIWLGFKILYRSKSLLKFNWTDCGFDFLKTCEENQWTIFFLGSTNDILMKARENLKKKYPRLKLLGSLNGYESVDSIETIKLINNLNVDILYVGLGTPKQEIWINDNAQKLNCKVIQAVGDLFSLYAEEKKRGPKFFQQVGLEWFFRLLGNPIKYARRYLLGIPHFFIIVIKEYFNKKSNE
jgi:N-acetylglucosaminyldiphosphoundecaprenol N-acetyl-beta-D-mannosaminyltransferase